MKKVLALLTAFVFVGLVACGPSADEQAKTDAAVQATADSIAAALLEQVPVTADTAVAPVPPDSVVKP